MIWPASQAAFAIGLKGLISGTGEQMIWPASQAAFAIGLKGLISGTVSK